VVEHVTFNHGVEGSSPSALTNEIWHNLLLPIPRRARVCKRVAGPGVWPCGLPKGRIDPKPMS
jgi:hypothetical protein